MTQDQPRGAVENLARLIRRRPRGGLADQLDGDFLRLILGRLRMRFACQLSRRKCLRKCNRMLYPRTSMHKHALIISHLRVQPAPLKGLNRVRDAGVVGSNPVTPTIFPYRAEIACGRPAARGP
jgi:hypothetical protein